jgi:hypothetical protein
MKAHINQHPGRKELGGPGLRSRNTERRNRGSFVQSTEAKEPRLFCVEHQSQLGAPKMEGSKEQQPARKEL